MTKRSKFIPHQIDPFVCISQGGSLRRPLLLLNLTPGPPESPYPPLELHQRFFPWILLLNPTFFDIVDIEPDTDDFSRWNVLWDVSFKKLLQLDRHVAQVLGAHYIVPGYNLSFPTRLGARFNLTRHFPIICARSHLIPEILGTQLREIEKEIV